MNGVVIPVEVYESDQEFPVTLDSRIALASNLQDKTGIIPTESVQTVTAEGGYDGLSSVQVEPIPEQYVVPTGTLLISENCTGADVRDYAAVDVDVPHGRVNNLQIHYGYYVKAAVLYTPTLLSLTVQRTGSYRVSWTAWRSTASGTMGTALYINGHWYGQYEDFIGPYGQNIWLNDVPLNAGDEICIYVKTGSSSRVMYVSNLIIEQTE